MQNKYDNKLLSQMIEFTLNSSSLPVPIYGKSVFEQKVDELFIKTIEDINQRLQVISDKAQASFLQNNKIMGKHIPIEAGKNLRQNSIICINNTKQEIQQLNKTIEEIKLKRIEEYGTFFNVVFEVLPIKKTVTKKSTLKIKSSKRNINAIYSSIRILDPDIPNDQYPYVDKIDRTGNKIVLFPTQLPSGPLPKNMKVSSVEIISKLQQPSIIQSLRHSLRQSTTRR